VTTTPPAIKVLVTVSLPAVSSVDSISADARLNRSDARRVSPLRPTGIIARIGQTNGSLMKNATLCLILDEGERRILLGRKKRGFGAGKFNGFGGKIQPGESPRTAAAREVLEESHLTIDPADLRPAGSVTFLFPSEPDFDHHVNVFVVTTWCGEPRESSEMAPRWFPIDAIPYGSMWADDRHWLPLVLTGKTIEATFTFAEDNETLARWTLLEIGSDS